MRRLSIVFVALFGWTLTPGLTQAAENIAAFGDSITRGWPYYKNDANGIVNSGGYIPQFQSLLNSSECDLEATVRNYGHPGEYVYFQGRSRFSRQIVGSSANRAVIMEGTNDLAYEQSFGFPSTSHIAASLRGIVDSAIAADIEPVIGTVLPRFDKHRGANVTGLNAMIRDIAAEKNIILADFYAERSSSQWALMMPDGLHPDINGYSAMASILYDAMYEAGVCGSPSIVPIYLLLLLDD